MNNHTDPFRCPDMDALDALVRGSGDARCVDGLEQHLQVCGRCSDLVEMIRDALLTPTIAPQRSVDEAVPGAVVAAARESHGLHLPRPKPQPSQVAIGQIWTTTSVPAGPEATDPDSPHRLVCVVDGPQGSYDMREPDIGVALISAFIEEAVPGSEIVSADESPIGVPFVVEPWNRQPMLVAGLEEYYGELDSTVTGRVRAAVARVVALPGRGSAGPQLALEPPVVAFRRSEVLETAYLREPVEHMIRRWEELRPRSSPFAAIRRWLTNGVSSTGIRFDDHLRRFIAECAGTFQFQRPLGVSVAMGRQASEYVLSLSAELPRLGLEEAIEDVQLLVREVAGRARIHALLVPRGSLDLSLEPAIEIELVPRYTPTSAPLSQPILLVTGRTHAAFRDAVIPAETHGLPVTVWVGIRESPTFTSDEG